MSIDLSDRTLIESSVVGVMSALGVSIDPRIQSAYLSGELRTLASYEKVEASDASVPAVVRMLVVCLSQLAQPSLESYYDIHRAARIVPLVVSLNRAIQVLKSRQVDFSDHREKLATLTDFDEFDSAMFELVVMAQYARNESVVELRFVPPHPSMRTPDFRFVKEGREFLVECKRFDRQVDAEMGLRDCVRSLVRPTLAQFAVEGVFCAFDVVFRCDPSRLDSREIDSAMRDALQSGGAVFDSRYVVVARRVAPVDLSSDCILTPSPAWWGRLYGFVEREQWHGVVESFVARFAGPSFVEDVRAAAGLRWRVEDEEVMRKQRRLGYARILKGIDQLRGDGCETVLHVCFERRDGVGSRHRELAGLVRELWLKKKMFGWVVANELDIHVTPQGRFDFREHAHFIPGPFARGKLPPESLVFMGEAGLHGGASDFGKGVPLPPLDGC